MELVAKTSCALDRRWQGSNSSQMPPVSDDVFFCHECFIFYEFIIFKFIYGHPVLAPTCKEFGSCHFHSHKKGKRTWTN
jgi:hypothetical protein